MLTRRYYAPWASILACALASLFVGCSPQNPEPHNALPASVLQPLPVVTPSDQTLALWQQQQTLITEALHHAEQLNQAIAQLLHTPNPEQLEAARSTWFEAVRAIEALTTIEQLASKQTHPTWQALAAQFAQIAAWPSRLGYLDDNGIHGATGLIFDLDTPITAAEIRHQHQLTGDYDLTVGLYPIGQILMGYGATRDAEVFAAVDTLTDALRVKGFDQAQEVPSNRRRQLIELQATLLLEEIRLLQELWQARQSNSAINAFSQFPKEVQRQHLRIAVLDLVSHQLRELHERADQPVWQDDEKPPHTVSLRALRWQAQLDGAQQWLAAIGADSSALSTLQSDLSAWASAGTELATASSPQSTSSTAANSESSTSSDHEEQGQPPSLDALFAQAILALRPDPASNSAASSTAAQ